MDQGTLAGKAKSCNLLRSVKGCIQQQTSHFSVMLAFVLEVRPLFAVSLCRCFGKDPDNSYLSMSLELMFLDLGLQLNRKLGATFGFASQIQD